MPKPRKTVESDAVRWAASNTDFVRTLAKEISVNLSLALKEEFSTAANDVAMSLYIWYRKLGSIPQAAIRKFEIQYGLEDDVVRRLMQTYHLEDNLQSVSVNDVVKVDRLREIETLLADVKRDYEREKERNNQLQEKIISMMRGKTI